MRFPRPLPRRLLRSPPDLALSLTFRAARADDAAGLQRACFPHYPDAYFNASFERILRDQAAGRCVQLVVEAAGEGIIATGQLIRYSDTRAEIADLAVAEGWREQGVGTALIRVLIRIAGHSGIRRLEIGATDDNPRALALYRRLGFRPLREVELPGGGQAFFLIKTLRQSVEDSDGEIDEKQ